MRIAIEIAIVIGIAIATAVAICMLLVIWVARYLWRKWVLWGRIAEGFAWRTSYVPDLQPVETPHWMTPHEYNYELVPLYDLVPVINESSVAETNAYIPVSSLQESVQLD